jgi:hypothetical protein
MASRRGLTGQEIAHIILNEMKLRARLGLLAFGAFLALYGLGMINRGILVYENHRRLTNYSYGTIATGIFISLLAFLPPVALVNRWLAPKQLATHHRPEHHRKHGPK